MGTRRLCIALFCCFCLPHIIEAYHQQVFVDQSGHANFTKIQRLLIRSQSTTAIGPSSTLQPAFTVIVGAGKRKTTVEWGDHDSVAQSPTFATVADNTVVKSLTFVNTYNFPNKGKVNRNPRIPAVAALINGDKCAFYSVGFSGVQDTLWDADGRHFFHLCTIQGAVDFIFGNGQSIYKKCVINVLGATLKPGVAGYITAQGRTNPYDASGFVFTDNLVHGTGKAFLVDRGAVTLE
ncbi:hypothetical protein Bca52824_047651 [Brassica carinata]|uniref:Pectinesterase n=1 Tax=Brassica carinata TaxID=52824 RepID=A0A8X7URG8_BRACI|nr:hypothetical protein Bca52824_047651 [Brassica carinata]